MSDPAQLLVEHLDIWTGAIERKNGAGRGNGGKISLYGIEKLRNLILDLAARGKLVPQDPKDEPASALLPKIEAAAKKLLAQKAINGSPTCRPLPPKQQWYQVPKNWEWVSLGSCTNYGFSKKTDGDELPTDTWVLELEDVEKGTSRLIQKTRFGDKPFQSSKSVFQAGDVIYGKLRPYLDKVIVADEGGVCTTEMIPIRGHHGIDAHYLRLFLKSPLFVEYASSSVHGMNLPRLATDRARQAPFALPPFAEQKRIVAKVDELMALCDALEAGTREAMAAHEKLVRELLGTLVNSNDADDLAVNWSRIEANFDTLFTTEESIDALKQTILELAVRGKLVPHDSTDVPACNLLSYIAKQRQSLLAEKKIPKPRPLPSKSEVKWPFPLPETWSWSMLGDLCYQVSDGPHFSPQYVDESSGVPFLSTRNVRAGSFDMTSLKYVSRSDHEDFCKRIRPERDDILYTKGGTTGLAKVNDLDFEFSVWVHLAVLRIEKQKLEPRYVELALNSPHCFAQSQHYTQGIANFDLGLTRMIKITIPLPPLAEQKRIVERVDELNSLADALKQALISTQTLAGKIANAITFT